MVVTEAPSPTDFGVAKGTSPIASVDNPADQFTSARPGEREIATDREIFVPGNNDPTAVSGEVDPDPVGPARLTLPIVAVAVATNAATMTSNLKHRMDCLLSTQAGAGRLSVNDKVNTRSP